ncbi:MAG: hypothetical protein MJ252_28970, partial [archaeon]|nr:hypothetical protein [archaeon]
MSLSFSSPIKFSGEAKFSPNQKLFAITRGMDLRIYDTVQLQLINKYTFCDYIENIQWSNDSNLIMIALYKRGIVEVKQMKKMDWICRIQEGIAGINYALFSPDSRNILTICNNNIKLTIWSLTTKTTLRISLPKFSRKGLSFTSKGNFMALALRTSPQDSVGVYFLGNWTQINKFDVMSTDLQDLQWSYDNSSILIWDNPLVCKLYIYSPVGDCIDQIEPYSLKLGIKNCVLSPNGRMISLGCYDQSVKLYNNISYTLITSLDHSSTTLNLEKVNYFVESQVTINQSKYVSMKPPLELVSIMPKTSDIQPKMGIKKMEYSPDSNFLATLNENIKNTIFVWEMIDLNLYTVIVQLNGITDFKWSPKENVLFIVTDNNKLYYYNLDSIFITDLPINFRANEIVFNTNGKKIILKDPDYMILVDYNSGGILMDEELNRKSRDLKNSNLESKNSNLTSNREYPSESLKESSRVEGVEERKKERINNKSNKVSQSGQMDNQNMEEGNEEQGEEYQGEEGQEYNEGNEEQGEEYQGEGKEGEEYQGEGEEGEEYQGEGEEGEEN